MKLEFAKYLMENLSNKKLKKTIMKMDKEECEYNKACFVQNFEKCEKADALYDLGISYNNLADTLDESGERLYAIKTLENALKVTNLAMKLYRSYYKTSLKSHLAILALNPTQDRINEYQANLTYLKKLYKKILPEAEVGNADQSDMPLNKKQCIEVSREFNASESANREVDETGKELSQQSMSNQQCVNVVAVRSLNPECIEDSPELNICMLAITGLFKIKSEKPEWLESYLTSNECKFGLKEDKGFVI